MILMGVFQLEIFYDSFCLRGLQHSAVAKSAQEALIDTMQIGGGNPSLTPLEKEILPWHPETRPPAVSLWKAGGYYLDPCPVLLLSPKPCAAWEKAACRTSCKHISQQEACETGGRRSSLLFWRRGQRRIDTAGSWQPCWGKEVLQHLYIVVGNSINIWRPLEYLPWCSFDLCVVLMLPLTLYPCRFLDAPWASSSPP